MFFDEMLSQKLLQITLFFGFPSAGSSGLLKLRKERTVHDVVLPMKTTHCSQKLQASFFEHG